MASFLGDVDLHDAAEYRRETVRIAQDLLLGVVDRLLTGEHSDEKAHGD